jgi:hypothetical protein
MADAIRARDVADHLGGLLIPTIIWTLAYILRGCARVARLRAA